MTSEHLPPHEPRPAADLVMALEAAANRCTLALAKIDGKFRLTPAKVHLLRAIELLGEEPPIPRRGPPWGNRGAPQSAIVAFLATTGANVSGLIARLVRARLVSRRRDQGDRRRKRIALTPKGEAVIRKVWPPHHQCMERLAADLSATERALLSSLLTRLR